MESASITEVPVVTDTTPTPTPMTAPAPVSVDTTTAAEAKEAEAPVSGPRGAFIVLEGLDRSGKTTQGKLLAQRLIETDRDVKLMRFPDRTTTIGKMIDEYLKSEMDLEDHVVHLLFSANRWEAAKEIKTTLARGTTIVCDRYYYSGIVYSAAKQNPLLPLSWARNPEVGLPRPDVVVFLDLDAEAARERGGFGEEKYEKKDFQRRVRELFKGFEKEGVEEKGDIVVVDAAADLKEVSKRIWEGVQPRVETVENGELGTEVRVVA